LHQNLLLKRAHTPSSHRARTEPTPSSHRAHTEFTPSSHGDDCGTTHPSDSRATPHTCGCTVHTMAALSTTRDSRLALYSYATRARRPGVATTLFASVPKPQHFAAGAHLIYRSRKSPKRDRRYSFIRHISGVAGCATSPFKISRSHMTSVET
jgi:hypothetical protein